VAAPWSVELNQYILLVVEHDRAEALALDHLQCAHSVQQRSEHYISQSAIVQQALHTKHQCDALLESESAHSHDQRGLIRLCL
jgi:hypothetical protein